MTKGDFPAQSSTGEVYVHIPIKNHVDLKKNRFYFLFECVALFSEQNSVLQFTLLNQ